MSANTNNNQPKNIGGSMSSPFGNAGMVNPNLPPNFNPSSSSSQPQGQNQPHQLGFGFQNQFQLAQAQAHALAQAQSKAAAAAHAHLLQAQGMSLNQSQAMGMGNLGGNSSPSMSGPGNSGIKRVPQKPPVRPPGPSGGINLMSPMRNMMDLTPAAAARRKKQKPQEKHLSDRVAPILPESALYTQLLEFESRVDSALTRKKIDIQEALKNPPSVQKTLRIYVFNTFANQNQSAPNKPNAEPPTWTLKVIGRILEDGVDPEQLAAMKPNPMYPKFSNFFKRVTIALDQRLYPENHSIVWENSRASAPTEGFEVKRKGDKEFMVNIRFDMNYMPEKFKLSPPLTELLGIEAETRPRIIAAIWHYVKARKLQNPNDPTFFNCDPQLQKVFGEEKMKFTMVSQKISQHLTPPPPIQVDHQIKLSGNSPAGNACYDILVDIPFPIQRELSMLLANTEKTKEIEVCDEAICAAIRKIHEHRRRRAFFLGFSQSPVEFINALIESQSRDLKAVSGEASRSAERERRSEFFNQPWVEDAVIRYLTRKPANAPDGPGST
ncbi:SWI/SNF complex component SNF12 homolog [Chenopodium quinoa]|uniref:SWI/SNF complex component SNF12 homolog n=1 Tax=Chenopodium quinoa TaxID=63459 RepID=UPI000B77BA91|nr:SWI/SNF complex component SNF12 homolog [Chenopodium quinoa]